MNGKSKEKVFCAVCFMKCVGNVLRVQERYFHMDCFRCSGSLAQGGVFHIDGKCYCNKDYQKLFSVKCTHCKNILSGEYMIKDGLPYCKDNSLDGQSCSKSFYENFTVEHLPDIIRQGIKVNSSSIDSFICRHFLKITNTTVFLDYPVKVIEYICKLDLMVHSEFQVFESIMKWIEAKDSRKRHLARLLDCIRWCHLSFDDLNEIETHELIAKSSTKLDQLRCATSDCKCGLKRDKQHFFIYIFQGDASLHIMAECKELGRITIGEFTEDDSMSLEFIHSEHISDVFFDSGRKGIRIDWIKNTFRWLDFKDAVKTYYIRIYESIIKFSDKSKWLDCYLQDEDAELSSPVKTAEEVFLESNGKFIALGKTRKEKRLFGLFPVISSSWFNHYKNRLHSFHATVLENVVYILTDKLEFIQYNYETKYFNISVPFDEDEFAFDNLILTSHQAKDDKVILVDKLSGKMYIYYVDQKKWERKYQTMNVGPCSNSANLPVDKLITFTSTFLSMKNIKPLYKRKFVPF